MTIQERLRIIEEERQELLKHIELEAAAEKNKVWK
jgi:hypothetical protein